MNFQWTPKQTELRQSAVEFAQKELTGDVITRDRDGTFARELWQKCADFGIFSKSVPGGFAGEEGMDFLELALFMEGLGYGCLDNGFVFALGAQILAIQTPVARFGTEEQKEKFLTKMCAGKWIGAHALTEPETGSDVYNIHTIAEKVSGGYRLNGSKRLVTLAPAADVFLTFATINPKLGKWGLTAFLVERDREGVIPTPVQEKMGLRTVPIGGVTFKDCFVPDSNVLDKEGAGLAISTQSLEIERCGILSAQVGAMERQLEVAIKYAKERQQYGQPISNFQSVSNRIAEMRLRLETARLLLYKTAWLKKESKEASLDSALLKLHLSECFVESSMDAIRIHGGNGYLTENGIERDLRDSIGAVIYAGTSDIQRNVIAKLLGV